MLDEYLLNLWFWKCQLRIQKILGLLKVRSAPMDSWILHTMNIETFDYNIESWVGEAISKGMRRHQNAKCFNSDRLEYLRRDNYCRQWVPRNNISSGNGKNRRLSLQVYVEGLSKADIGPMNTEQQKTDKTTWYHREKTLKGLSQAPKSKVVQSFPVTVEDMSH